MNSLCKKHNKSHWIDITDIFNISSDLLLPHECYKCRYFSFEQAGSALELGNKHQDYGYQPNQRFTLKRAIELQHTDVSLNPNLTKEYKEIIVEIMDGLLIKTVEFLCGSNSRLFSFECLLYICELYNRLMRLAQTQLPTEFPNTCYWQILWNLRQANHTPDVLKDLIEYDRQHYQLGFNTNSLIHNFKQLQSIKLLPSGTSHHGTLPSIKHLIFKLQVIIQDMLLEKKNDQSWESIHNRLELCHYWLKSFQFMESLASFNVETFTEMIQCLIQCHRLVSLIEHKSPLCQSTNFSSHITSRSYLTYFQTSLVEFMNVYTSPRVSTTPFSFPHTIYILKSLFSGWTLILPTALISLWYPQTQSIYEGLLRSLTKETPYQQHSHYHQDTFSIWAPYGTLLSSISYVFLVYIIPLTQVIEPWLSFIHPLQDQFLLYLFGPLIDPNGKDTGCLIESLSTIKHQMMIWRLNNNRFLLTCYNTVHDDKEISQSSDHTVVGLSQSNQTLYKCLSPTISLFLKQMYSQCSIPSDQLHSIQTNSLEHIINQLFDKKSMEKIQLLRPIPKPSIFISVLQTKSIDHIIEKGLASSLQILHYSTGRQLEDGPNIISQLVDIVFTLDQQNTPYSTMIKCYINFKAIETLEALLLSSLTIDSDINDTISVSLVFTFLSVSSLAKLLLYHEFIEKNTLWRHETSHQDDTYKNLFLLRHKDETFNSSMMSSIRILYQTLQKCCLIECWKNYPEDDLKNELLLMTLSQWETKFFKFLLPLSLPWGFLFDCIESNKTIDSSVKLPSITTCDPSSTWSFFQEFYARQSLFKTMMSSSKKMAQINEMQDTIAIWPVMKQQYIQTITEGLNVTFLHLTPSIIQFLDKKIEDATVLLAQLM